MNISLINDKTFYIYFILKEYILPNSAQSSFILAWLYTNCLLLYLKKKKPSPSIDLL